jgi:hypothetical protein
MQQNQHTHTETNKTNIYAGILTKIIITCTTKVYTVKNKVRKANNTNYLKNECTNINVNVYEVEIGNGTKNDKIQNFCCNTGITKQSSNLYFIWD